jgi:hypothetical protein
LEDQLRLRQIRRRKIFQRCSKRLERGKDPRGILNAGLHPDVEIFREAWLAMEGDRVSTHEQVFSARVVQRGKQIAEVEVHRHRVLAMHGIPAQGPTLALAAHAVGRSAKTPGRMPHHRHEVRRDGSSLFFAVHADP